MKKEIIGIFVTTLLIAAVVSQVSACTGFTASDDNTVLVGSNEDWHDFNFNIRFFPAEDGKHGMMFFEVAEVQSDGTNRMVPFAGMNDQGCWYDGYATPYLLPVNSSDKPYFTNLDCYYENNYAEYCLSKFSTVNEVVEDSVNYNAELFAYVQYLLVDATGNSVIAEGDDWIYKEGDFQVVTNFLQSHPELGGITDTAFERYDTAVSMLENMTDLSVDYFRDICNATHAEVSSWSTDWSWTVYSWICDLKNQIIYLYHFYDYENVVVIDLNEELAKGEHYIYLGSLFEPDDNQPPNKPNTPWGEKESGNPGVNYKFNFRRPKDPENHGTSILIDWGDGTSLGWTRTIQYTTSFYHNWSEQGTYEVRVKAMDQYGAESDWSDPIAISIAKNKPCMKQYFFNLLEIHPNLFPTLRQLLKL
jgi:penicillin V acylase-like amidase (Ntn superfamily)